MDERIPQIEEMVKGLYKNIDHELWMISELAKFLAYLSAQNDSE